MKEYASTSKIVDIIFTIIGVIVFPIYVIDELFHLKTDITFFYIFPSILVGIILVSPIKYFSGFASLYIDNKNIRCCIGYISLCRIRYEQAHVRSVLWYGKYCKVFSKKDLRNCNAIEIRKEVFLRRAIIFPWDPKMDDDFPELMIREYRETS